MDRVGVQQLPPGRADLPQAVEVIGLAGPACGPVLGVERIEASPEITLSGFPFPEAVEHGGDRCAARERPRQVLQLNLQRGEVGLQPSALHVPVVVLAGPFAREALEHGVQLALKSEGPNLDYQAGFEWNKSNRDLKYELVRDLMALRNTKAGGRVVFGVRDADLEFVGVSTAISESIDPSDVVGMLHDNAAPKVRCAIYKREIDGKRIVVFDVAEFEDTPIICTNGISSQDWQQTADLATGGDLHPHRCRH